MGKASDRRVSGRAKSAGYAGYAGLSGRFCRPRRDSAPGDRPASWARSAAGRRREVVAVKIGVGVSVGRDVVPARHRGGPRDRACGSCLGAGPGRWKWGTAPLMLRVGVRAGGYDALTGAALLIVTAGVNEAAGSATDRADPAGRLRLRDGASTYCPRPAHLTGFDTSSLATAAQTTTSRQPSAPSTP